MTDDYEIPTGDTGHEPGTFLMVLTALKPFTLYETRNGWTREKPEDGTLVEAYNKIAWVFADVEGDETAEGTTSTARSERSTLFAWATGLGLSPQMVLDRTKPIPASQLIGRQAMVTFQPDPKSGYSRIKSVVPAPRARATAPAAVPAGPIREVIPPLVPGAGPAVVVPSIPIGAFGEAGPQPAAEVPGTRLPNQVDDLPF
jgi:hypothetical protein